MLHQQHRRQITCCVVHDAYQPTHAVQEVAKGGFPFPSMFRALSAQGLPLQVSLTDQQLVPVAPSKPLGVPNTSGGKYESPLVVFRSYR